MSSRSNRNNHSSNSISSSRSNSNNNRRHQQKSNDNKLKQPSRNSMSPTPYTSTPPNATRNNNVVATQKEEERITTDDLEAMKAMIGDIKKDPSLLYRLSSLSGSPPPPHSSSSDSLVRATAVNTSTNNVNSGGVNNGGRGYTSTPQKSSPPHHNLNRGGGGPITQHPLGSSSVTNTSLLKFNTDDSTEVSSIGMMSSDDYNSYLHPTPSSRTSPVKQQVVGGGLSTHEEFDISNGKEEGRVPTIQMGSPQPPNQSRTNRDAEIALRMQSLRAMRDWNKQQGQGGSQGQVGVVSPSGNGGSRRASPTNVDGGTANSSNSGGGGEGLVSAGVSVIASPTSSRNDRGEDITTTTNNLYGNNLYGEDNTNQQQQQPVQSLPSPIQSPQPMNASSSSRRREGKSSSGSSSNGGRSKSKSRRKDTTAGNYHHHHRNKDVDNNNIRNNSNDGDEDDLRIDTTKNEEDSSNSHGEVYHNNNDDNMRYNNNNNNDEMGGNPIELYAPQHIRGGGGESNGGGNGNSRPRSQDDGNSFEEEEEDDEMGIGEMVDDLYAPRHHHRGGGGNSSNSNNSQRQQQQQQDEWTLRRISEATTETEMSTLRGDGGGSSRRSGAVQAALAAAEARKVSGSGGDVGGGGGTGSSSSRSGNRSSRGSPRGGNTATRSSRSSSRSSRNNKGGSGGGGGGRRPVVQRSASQGDYIGGASSPSVQDGNYRQQQQQQQQPHQQSNSRGSKHRSFHGSSPPLEPIAPSSTQSAREYARRTNDEESSSSKHSFHESSSTRQQYGRRRNTSATSEQGINNYTTSSRSFSYSDDHHRGQQQHDGGYDGGGRRQQQQPHQQQEQHSHPPQDQQPQSQSFSVNEQTSYRGGDHSITSGDDPSFQVKQLAKLYARGDTLDKGGNADGGGRGDAQQQHGDEPIAPSQLFSSSHEDDGRQQRRTTNHPQSIRGRGEKRYSMNDMTLSSSNHVGVSSNRYDTSQNYSPNDDDDDNLEVNTKAKSVSMIVTSRDAEESISPTKKSPTRKSKKSSKKSSRESNERKNKSTRSKSKVRVAPSSRGAEDSREPLSASEAMGASLRSSESSDRATSPEKQSSFNNFPRFPKKRASIDKHFNASSASGSVMNRLSHPLRSLKPSPSKDSLRSTRTPSSRDSYHRASPYSGSFEFQDDQSALARRSTLDSTNISDEHDSQMAQKQKKNKLISRLKTSPTQQLDACGSISIADDDDEHAVSLGIELALMNGDVPRLCDAKGRCLFHPHIRLQKPKLFGGWKILFKHCPDCAVEHMRATQDKMAEKKKKKRREKKNDEKKRTDERKKSDPIIAMNVGDDDFTPKKSKKKKKKHRDDGEKKEEVQEPLESLVPAPEPQMDEDYQSVMSDAVTNYEQSYQQDSRAIVEHKPPRIKKVNGLPWSDYNGQSGRYTGEVNEQYLPHGRGEMVYDKGLVSAGIWYNGVLDTEEPVSMDGYVPHRLPNYEIGDKGTDEDMIITSKRETAAAVSQIRMNDAAFVRRSDGSWTYAIVKDQVDDGRNRSIRFKVNTRGSTKSFPPSQWGTYIRCINTRTEVNTNRRSDAPSKRSAPGLGEYLDSNNRRPAQPVGHSSHSVAGNFTGYSGDASVSSTHSAPILDRSRSADNLTTAKMRIKSRSRSRGRKNVTTLPLLFSSSMSVSEEAEDDSNDEWETASGSGYRLRGIDP